MFHPKGISETNPLKTIKECVMRDYQRVLLLVSVLSAVAISIGISAIFILYRTSFEEQGLHLVETVQRQVRLLESVARFDSVYSRDYPGGSIQATLSQIQEAHNRYRGFGETGEFTLAERKDDKIVFHLHHDHSALGLIEPVAWNSDLAEPMRRALSGHSGTVVALDHRGVKVLAAYEPVNILNFGAVAKIDMAEVRHPFIKAAVVVTIIALALIAAGTWLFFRITDPMLKRITESEERFRSITTVAQDAIIVMDSEGLISFWNKAAEEMFGYQTKEALGQTLGEMLIPARNRTAHTNGLEHFKNTGEGPMINKTIETEAVRRNGAEFPVELSITAVQLDRSWSAVGIVRDISARKEAEDQARQHEAELAHMARLSTLGEMATTLAHELNQPLMVISTYAGGAARRLRNIENNDCGMLLEALEKITDAAKRAAEIIRGVRRFVRKQDTKWKRIDINKVVTEAIKLTAAEARRRRMKITIENTHNNFFVMGNPTQLEQVTINLIRNAFDAMEEIDENERTLVIQTDLSDRNRVELRVRDTGTGLAPDIAPQILEPFVTTKQNGLGMGLSICRTIVDAHGGHLWTSANPDRGTTFHVSLPVSSKKH